MSAGEVLDVRVAHRVHAGLSLDVSLRLGRECGIVFGDSGAGKTTLLRLIAGLARPHHGRIVLGDETLFDSEARIDRPLRLRKVGMIFQDDLLFPHLSIAANIRYGLKGWSRTEAAARLAEVASLCGVEPLLGRRPATLSGGERQRVGLARALAPRPRLLLCDEPVSALDLASRNALVDRLRAVQRSEGIPVLYVTHSPAEAIALGTRLFLIERGRLIGQGTPLDVLASRRSGHQPHLDAIRNVFPARVDGHGHSGETHLRLIDGPELIVPTFEGPAGLRVSVEVRADDVLLARGPIQGLSARNTIPGAVERIVPHGDEAEVLVRTGGVTWIVSVVAPAVASLGLAPDVDVFLIVKARSCHVRRDDES